MRIAIATMIAVVLGFLFVPLGAISLRTESIQAQCSASLDDSLFELTQAIQNDPRDSSPAETDPYLVRNRRIGIRMYQLGSCTGMGDVYLRVRYGGNTLFGPELSDTGPRKIQTNPNYVCRDKYSADCAPLAWNWILPDVHTLTFEFSLDSSFTEYRSIEKWLRNNRRPLIYVVRVDNQFLGSPDGTFGAPLVGKTTNMDVGIYSYYPIEEPCDGGSLDCGSTLMIRPTTYRSEHDINNRDSPGQYPLFKELALLGIEASPQPDWVIGLINDGLYGGYTGASYRPSTISFRG